MAISMLPYLYEFERPFRFMERDFLRPTEEIIGCIPFPLAPRGFVPPHRLENGFRPLESTLRTLDEIAGAMGQMGLNDLGSKITSNDENFQVNVDVQHFSPNEINVKVIDGQVIIEGKHEEKRDEHGYISRQFVRKYTLPDGCLPDTVQSKLSSDGVLTVTAPKVLAMPSTGERIVPIAHTGPVQKQLGIPDINEPGQK